MTKHRITISEEAYQRLLTLAKDYGGDCEKVIESLIIRQDELIAEIAELKAMMIELQRSSERNRMLRAILDNFGFSDRNMN